MYTLVGGESESFERVMSLIRVRLSEPNLPIENADPDHVAATESIEGPHPEWNSNLTLKLKSKVESGFNDRELLESKGTLYFSLFDYAGDIKQEADNPQRYNVFIEHKYLGSFSIPLLTLFQNPKQEAQYRVDRPVFLIGYYNTTISMFAINPVGENTVTTDPQIPTYVTIALTLDPILEIQSKNDADYYPGGEESDLLLAGNKWLNVNVRQNARRREKNIKLWGENLNGYSIFMPRFLTPLRPPGDPLDENAYQEAARYVALIPFKIDSQAFQDLPDIWANCQEFLDLRAGDYEEHAILLCNYFNFIDREQKKTQFKNYLVLGKGVPEGNTVYVLRRNTLSQEVEIWNAIYGEPYFFKREIMKTNFLCIPCKAGTKMDPASSATCPLQQVNCVVSDENVWINKQAHENPLAVNFDLNNKRDWMPFLTYTSSPL